MRALAFVLALTACGADELEEDGPMLVGLLGTSRQIAGQPVQVINARAVVGYDPRHPSSGVEDSVGAIITFDTPLAGNPILGGNATVTVGAGGMTSVIGPFAFAPGFTLPVKGSHFKVVLNPVNGPTYTAGAQIALGTRVAPAVLSSADILIPKTGVATIVPLPISSFIDAIKVVRSPNTEPLSIGIPNAPGAGGGHDVDLPTGSNMLWEDVEPVRLLNNGVAQVTLVNGGANDVIASVLCRLSL